MKGSYRIAVVAAVFALLFGFLGIRLWFMQVGEGVAAAEIVSSEGSGLRCHPGAPRRHPGSQRTVAGHQSSGPNGGDGPQTPPILPEG